MQILGEERKDKRKYAEYWKFKKRSKASAKLAPGLILLVFLAIGIGAGLFCPLQSASATAPKPAEQLVNPTGGNGTPADLNDPVAVGTFIDEVMSTQMDQFHLPGAVISIVKDGKVLYAKGYGHANRETGAPVDPKTSLFRIASTTKLFTWTAVMQLVEQGKIDLDTDVNTYLKTVKIPDTYPQPITMRHLLTHTAGFEEGGVGYQITTDPRKLPVSISATLAKHMPARVRPPGEMIAYSNYGAALAGLIVEEVSGIPYDEYIQKHIFEPLDMKYATVQEPVPASLEPYKVLGYAFENGSFVTKPLTFEGGFRPAGSGSVSALDMARFMIAHLQDGRYEDKRILKPETARLMHSPAFRFDERLPAMDLGFYEQRFNGLRAICHGGSDPLFNTEMYLVPDKQLGIFVSYSGGQGSEAAEGLANAFFDQYFPAPVVNLPPLPANFAETGQKYAGTYEFTRRNFSKIDKFFSFGSQINVSVSDKGLAIGEGDEQLLFTPIGPDLFQQVGGLHQLGFRTDASGKVTHLFLDFFPYMPLERAPLFDQAYFWIAVLGIAAVLFISVFIWLAFRWRVVNAMARPQKWAVWLSAATAGLALATCVMTFGVVMSMDMLDRLSRISPTLILFLLMPIILVGLTAATLLSALMAWKNKYWTVFKRVHYTLVAFSAVAVSLFYFHWNLIGWQFG